ncbi:MAG: SCO family protein [Bacteroidetes bacterium]|nr:SCO family protein [Bacteroidota bacterium]
MKKILPPLLVLAVCVAILWKWTYGFSAFTVFSYTLREAGAIPRIFPDAALIDQDSSVFHIKDKQKYVLVNFVYLNCPYVCHKVNNRLEEIDKAISPEIIPSQLELVTVSFDVGNDNIRKIKNYRNRFGSDIHGWSFALPHQTSQSEFDTFLLRAGIWAKAAPGGSIINHSIYLFLVSPENKIVKIFDPAREDDASIIEKIRSCIKG